MRKLVPILLCMLLMVTACSSPSTTGSSAEPGKTSSPATAANATLKLMLNSADDVPAFNKIIEEFQKTNPTVKFEVNAVPGTDTFITALKAKYSSGDAPDLYTFQVGARTAEFANAGLLLDITDTPLLANIKKDDLKLVTYKGKVYAAPLNAQATGIYMNQEIFDKYGLKAPENFGEFLNVNKVLREKGIKYPMIVAGKDVGHVSQFDFQYLATVVVPNDPDYYKKMLKGELHFNSPVIRTMFERYGMLKEYVSPDALGVDADEAVKRLIKGDGAMLMNLNSLLPTIRRYGPDTKLTMVPSALQDKTEDRILNVGVTTGLHISSSSKYPEEAKKFIQFALTPAMGNVYSKEAKQLSTVVGVTDVYDDSLKTMLPWLNGNKKSPHADLVWIPGIKDIMKEVTQKWFLGEPLDSVINQWEEQHQRLMKANPSFVENFGKE
ncbi:ABC-type glycerol-3-phosphate transport system, substrate-binding protein [Paenibacillus sp. 1_12]|uniref:ABC transporter substrate-binding protein n=1 Tax=Paenibacillus sp. 1_12 TaxID=1566278 RepID=UPI0008E21A14|nr:extracellular solute-binding protein [Paenibacillus sp. 1_12]SFM27406.1 ABC-type glycerol-3-phosphate transport system, substrate-binding protein [Paenibacillus sp. 1_12]